MVNPNTPPPRAPWRSLFESHLSKMPATEFSLATVYQDASGKAYPRVRTCILRSFWGELALRGSAREEMRSGNAYGTGENPAVYESDMLAFTTDVRMEKVGQIESGENGGRAGGEVEAMFWVKDAMTQWRLKGKAFAVGGDGGDSMEKEIRENVWAWMRACPGNNEPSSLDKVTRSWSWDKEVTAHFANMSPIMRGTFKNPPPGTARSALHDPSLEFGQEVHDLQDPIARANFRVVAIQPWEVEYVDLSSMKRFRWVLSPGESEIWRWEEEELWP